MNPEIIKINISQDEEVFAFLHKMLDLRSKEGKEVEGTLENGQVITTQGCSNFEEILVANSEILLSVVEDKRNELLNSRDMQLATEIFKNRGTRSDPTRQINPNAETNRIAKEYEFKSKIKELDTLDYAKPMEVYNWLIDASEYINNPELYLSIDKNEPFYSYILKKLGENGYTKEINSVNSMNDYIKKIISYQLDDLDKYHFLATEYVDDYQKKSIYKDFPENINSDNEIQQDSHVNTVNFESPVLEEATLNSIISETNVTKDSLSTRLEELLKKQEEIQRGLNVLNAQKTGKVKVINNKLQKTTSYAERKANIESEIMILTPEVKSNNEKIEKEIATSKEQLETILRRPGRLSTEEENRVMQQYYTVMSSPSTNQERILPTIEMVNALPESSEIKPILLNILENTKTMTIGEIEPEPKNLENEIVTSKEQLETILRRPGRLSTEEENKVMQQYYTIMSSPSTNQERILPTIEMINALPESNEIKPILLNILENIRVKELDALKQKYEDIVQEEQSVIKHTEVLEEQGRKKLEDITKEIEKIQQEMENENKENQNSQPLQVEPSSESLSNPSKENEGQEPTQIDSFPVPLPNPPKEDESFDERLSRLAQEGPIMKEHEEDFDLTPQKPKPQFIKSIQKAPTKLKKFIQELDFKKKIVKILDTIEEKRKTGAIILGLAGLGLAGAAYATSAPAANTVIEQAVEEQNSIENNETVEEVATETKVEENQLNVALQDTINDILNGENVYRTAMDAANDTNSLHTNQSQRDNSWANATANTFYNNESEVISREEAEKIIADGGEVVASFDNEGTIIGYTKVGQENAIDTSGKSM